MDSAKDAEYHYEMVVNIVAEMVIEYMKPLSININQKTVRDITSANNESNESLGEQREEAA